MKTQAILAVILALGSVHSHGHEGAVRVYRDTGGMPRCLKMGAGVAVQEVLLHWDLDRFHQEVRAYPMDQLEVVRNSPGFPEDRSSELVGPFHCEQWKALARERVWGVSESAEGSTLELFGIPVDDESREAFSQLRAGGTVFRKESTAAGYLERHPVERFDRKLNRELTEKFGVGFAAEVYRLILRRDSTNERLRAAVVGRLEETGPIRIPELEHYRLVMTNGFGGNNSKGPSTVQEILDDFREMGVDGVNTPTRGYGMVDSNAKIVLAEIKRALDDGKRVILGSISRGTAETLTAIAALEAEVRSGAYVPASGEGRIVAYMNFSGLVEGSFVADWAKSNPLLTGVGWISRNFFWDFLRMVRAGGSLGTREIARRLEHNQRLFPRELPVINIVGVTPGDGVMPKGDMKTIQDLIIRPNMTHFGSNDGLIEYPGCEISRTIAPKAATLLVDADHTLLTGTFEGHRFTRDFRKAFFKALLEEAVERSLASDAQ